MAASPSHHHVSPEAWKRERRLSGRTQTPSDPISALLEKYKTIAVVGLSSRPSRVSCGVSAYMQRHGYRIIPVNPNESQVLGERCYATLEEIPEPLEIVLCFRQPQFMPAIVESAITRGARVVWMQEGIVNEKAAERARANGLTVVQDRCILKEHARRFLSEGL